MPGVNNRLSAAEIRNDLISDACTLYELTLSNDLMNSSRLDLHGKRIGDVILGISCQVSDLSDNLQGTRQRHGSGIFEAVHLYPLSEDELSIPPTRTDEEMAIVAHKNWQAYKIGTFVLGDEPISGVVAGSSLLSIEYTSNIAPNLNTRKLRHSRVALETAQSFLLSALDYAAGDSSAYGSETQGEGYDIAWNHWYKFNITPDLPLNGFEHPDFLKRFYKEMEDTYITLDNLLGEFKRVGSKKNQNTSDGYVENLSGRLEKVQRAIDQVKRFI